MERNDITCFKGLHYAKSAIYASEIKKGVKPYLLEPHPSKALKDVIESSPIFNDLKNKTDVYISSYITEAPDSSSEYIGHIRAVFRDPYRNKANNIDSINLTAIGGDEVTIFEKLKNISTALPIYKSFKTEKFIPGLRMLFLGKNACDGYIKRGEIL